MPYDGRCSIDFLSWHAYDQHITTSPNHHLCDDCNIDFPSWLGLKEHWVQSPNHDYCQYCNEHVDDIVYHNDYYHSHCAACNRVFKSDFGLKEHYRQSERHHYCAPCDRHFMSASNLNAHLNSSIHRSKDVKCPFGCGNAFVSRSALVLHFENGRCSSGINRAQVNRVIRQYDTNHIITDPSRMITGGTTNAYDSEVSYIATQRSWNGSGYQCCLCPSVFGQLSALNQHLASPRHQEKIYVCRGPQCEMSFSALSGYVQHVESDKCGVGRHRFVQDTMDRVLGQMGRLTM